MRSVAGLSLLAVCLLISSCSGGRDAARVPAAPPPPRTAPARPAPKKTAPITRTVQGFRIQILATPEKTEADRGVTEAESWWKTMTARARPAYLGDRALSVDIIWRQPYYRVRVGAFATRAEARQALAAVKRRFPDAFLVPDLVTITR